MNRPLRIGLIGAGAMGTNHARVIGGSPDTTLAVVVDRDIDRAAALGGGGAVATDDLWAASDCEAVVIASPTESHADIALDLLGRGIPLLVEKPLSADMPSVHDMVSASKARDVPLMCGFVERFNAAVITASKLVTEPPIHIVSMRHSPPAPRIATSVVFDLLIHDIDLAVRLAGGKEIAAVTCSSWREPRSGIAEVADCSLRFAAGAMATLSASRRSQRKIRSLFVSTADRLIEVDLLRQDVTVFRNVAQSQIGEAPTYRAETVVDIPFVRHAGEPLALQLAHFVGLVRGENDPDEERDSVLEAHRAATIVAESGRAGSDARIRPART
ncbi:MAG TPA: Gfo/Idh/MocA family oxidoreductase [Acidimicrobiales bacterium]|nr:Gfo/Idh/MocA family oxidoreductase [Acidimicrobiales bacterium]